jgi:hypothetical protein
MPIETLKDVGCHQYHRDTGNPATEDGQPGKPVVQFDNPPH